VDRRQFLERLGAAGAGSLALLLGLRARGGDAPASVGTSGVESVDAPASAWRPLLTAAQYRVLFQDGTERSFTSPLNDEKRKGQYLCAACHLPLFDSATKFDSRTGWPSFYDALPGRVATRSDYKLILPRTEYHCVRCGGHQGHVFEDGPKPTGLRYCNNGVALRFVPAGEALPELREPA